LASINEVDVKKYIEYMDSTFEQVLDALGISFEELIGNRRLESFFTLDATS
jgi:DNA polymerase I